MQIVKFSSGITLPNGKVELRRRAIAVAYLRAWFWIDLLSLLPWDLVFFDAMGSGDNTGLRVLRVVRVLRILRMVRLLELTKMAGFKRVKDRLDDWLMLSPVLAGVCKLLVVAGFTINLLGGMWCAPCREGSAAVGELAPPALRTVCVPCRHRRCRVLFSRWGVRARCAFVVAPCGAPPPSLILSLSQALYWPARV
jgi:hypothetical protein